MGVDPDDKIAGEPEANLADLLRQLHPEESNATISNGSGERPQNATAPRSGTTGRKFRSVLRETIFEAFVLLPVGVLIYRMVSKQDDGDEEDDRDDVKCSS